MDSHRKKLTSPATTDESSCVAVNAPSDVLTPEKRSLCMSSICGRDTKPEILLRKACWRLGMRYLLHTKLPGRPDFVFPR
ncbi:PDDEXK family nuclease [Comamonas koreensis]|uniref:hypothetical protein n=1 Tax=Comamonas koreensis TaxID=160825 RepID=UPI0038B2975D